MIVPVVGWIIGAVLLWVSRVWTVRDKLMGTLLVPGGLALAFFFGVFATSASSSCVVQLEDQPSRGVQTGICESEIVPSDMWWALLLVVLVIAPIATAIYLGRRAWRAS